MFAANIHVCVCSLFNKHLSTCCGVIVHCNKSIRTESIDFILLKQGTHDGISHMLVFDESFLMEIADLLVVKMVLAHNVNQNGVADYNDGTESGHGDEGAGDHSGGTEGNKYGILFTVGSMKTIMMVVTMSKIIFAVVSHHLHNYTMERCVCVCVCVVHMREREEGWRERKRDHPEFTHG